MGAKQIYIIDDTGKATLAYITNNPADISMLNKVINAPAPATTNNSGILPSFMSSNNKQAHKAKERLYLTFLALGVVVSALTAYILVVKLNKHYSGALPASPTT